MQQAEVQHLVIILHLYVLTARDSATWCLLVTSAFVLQKDAIKLSNNIVTSYKSGEQVVSLTEFRCHDFEFPSNIIM